MDFTKFDELNKKLEKAATLIETRVTVATKAMDAVAELADKLENEELLDALINFQIKNNEVALAYNDTLQVCAEIYKSIEVLPEIVQEEQTE